MLIALTGSIGSGKSTVADLLRDHGAAILDADVFAREALSPGSPALKEVEQRFGPSILNPDGTLDRKALGRRVFVDTQERKALERIVHPRVHVLFQEALFRIRAETPPGTPVVYVVPLFFEAQLPREKFDHVVCVLAPQEISIRRIMDRDSCSRDEALRRLSAQMPPDEKAARSDSVILNDADLPTLRERVSEWYRRVALPPAP